MRRPLLTLVLAASACGRSGGGVPPATGGQTGGGTLQPTATHVTGTFYLGSKSQPASDFEIWVFDHTAPSYSRVELSEKGGLDLPLTSFTEGHTYSLHLVRNWQLYGDVDLAPVLPGSQPAFTYQGGYGFDLGEVVVPVDRHGEPDLSGTGLVGNVGGGFSLVTSATGTFASYPLPDKAAASARLGSQLDVFDAETLLASFYRRAANPSLYAQDLQRLSRVGGTLTAATADGITRVDLVQGGDWLAGARQPSSDDGQPEASPFWSAKGNTFTAVDKKTFTASVYAGGLPPAGSVALVRYQPASGAEVSVPLVLPRLVTYPPEVTAVDPGTGTLAAVDYSATTGANGLTQPFCLKGGPLVVALAPPLDDAGQPIPPTTLGTVEASVDFYTRTGGQTAPLQVQGSSLKAPYDKAFTDTAISGLTRAWDPATLTVTFTLGPPFVSQASPALTFWANLFPSTVGGKTVTSVRLRLVYRSQSEATAAGAAVWLGVGC